VKPLHLGGGETERLQTLSLYIVERSFEDNLTVPDLFETPQTLEALALADLSRRRSESTRTAVSESLPRWR